MSDCEERTPDFRMYYTAKHLDDLKELRRLVADEDTSLNDVIPLAIEMLNAQRRMTWRARR